MSSIISYFDPCNPKIKAFQDFKKIPQKREKTKILLITILVSITTLGVLTTPVFRYLVGRVKKQDLKKEIDVKVERIKSNSFEAPSDTLPLQEGKKDNPLEIPPTPLLIEELSMSKKKVLETTDEMIKANCAIYPIGDLDKNQAEDISKAILLMAPEATLDGEPLAYTAERWRLLHEILERLDKKTINAHFGYGPGMACLESHLLFFAVEEMGKYPLEQRKVVELLLKKGADVYNNIVIYNPESVFDKAKEKALDLLPLLQSEGLKMQEELICKIKKNPFFIVDPSIDDIFRLFFQFSSYSKKGEWMRVFYCAVESFEPISMCNRNCPNPKPLDLESLLLNVMKYKFVPPLYKVVLTRLLISKGALVFPDHLEAANKQAPECREYLNLSQ